MPNNLQRWSMVTMTITNQTIKNVSTAVFPLQRPTYGHHPRWRSHTMIGSEHLIVDQQNQDPKDLSQLVPVSTDWDNISWTLWVNGVSHMCVSKKDQRTSSFTETKDERKKIVQDSEWSGVLEKTLTLFLQSWQPDEVRSEWSGQRGANLTLKRPSPPFRPISTGRDWTLVSSGSRASFPPNTQS